MLGKLWKHEWKSTWRVCCMMLLGLALITLFGWISFQAPLWQSAVSGRSYNGPSVWDLLSFGTLFMYIIMLVGINYGVFIYMGVRFYKTMYTDEGYLTHTLPVSKHQILVSKILNSGLWSVLMEVGIFLSVMALMFSMIGAMLPEGYTWADVWREIGPEMDFVDEMFLEIFGMRVSGYFGRMIVMGLISPFCSMIILFGAISIGQLFTKHRVLMAIVSYVGIMIVTSTVTSIVQSAFSLGQMASFVDDNQLVGGYVNTTILLSLGISITEAVILYFVCHYVTSKKLNME